MRWSHLEAAPKPHTQYVTAIEGQRAAALDAVAAATRALAEGPTLRGALATIAEAAASATGSDVVVARVLEADSGQLKARAVWAASAAVAAELEGSRFPAAELRPEEADEVAGLPEAVARAAERAHLGAVLQVPVVLDGRPVASLELMRPRERFTPDDRVLARLLAHQVGLAVRAFERVAELLGAERLAVYLREDGRLTAAAGRGLAGPHVRVAERLSDLALGRFRGRGILVVEDATADAELAPVADAVAEAGIEAALALPLRVHDAVIGLLAVYPPRDRPPSAHETAFLSALASQLAVAVQNAQLHEQAKRLGEELESALASERQAARQLGALYEISRSFAQTLSLETTLEAVARTVVDLLEVDAAVIRMPDERQELLVSRAIHVAEPRLDEAVRAVLARPQPMAKLLGRRLFRMGKPLRVDAKTAARLGSSYEPLVPL